MNFLSITIILISLLVIQKFHSIDGNVAQIYEKVKQEVEDLIDSQDYESVDEILKDSKIRVKYLDYYVPTTPRPTSLTTTTHPGKGVGKGNMRDSGELDRAASAEKGENGQEEGSSPIIYVVILIVVVIVVVGIAIGIFFYVKQSKAEKNKNIKKKIKRSTSRESLASVQTVASDTGKPIHSKPGAAKPAPKKK